MAADPLEPLLERWRNAGLISAGQAGSIRAFEERHRASGAGPSAPPTPPPPPAPPPPAPEPAPPAGRRPVPPAPVSPIHRARWQPAPLRPGFDSRTLGAVLAVLALLALLGSIFAVWTDLFVGPGSRPGSELEDVLHLVASVLGLVGGLRLARGLGAGRLLVYWSLGLNLASVVVLGHDRLAQPFTIATILTWIVLLFLTWRTRGR